MLSCDILQYAHLLQIHYRIISIHGNHTHGTTTLTFHAPIGTVILGIAISILVAVGAIALTLRKIFDRPAVELLSSRNGMPSAAPDDRERRGKASLEDVFLTLMEEEK